MQVNGQQAVIDIGSNSLRLMLGCCREGQWQFTPKKLATTRLGKDIDRTGQLSPEGMERSFAALSAWQEQLGTIPVWTVATSAVREAGNGRSFMARIQQQFGWHTRILSGTEEAELSFCGATSAIRPAATVVVVDIGGGSTETAVGSGGKVAWAHSYPMGAVRFSEHFPANACAAQWLEMPVRPDMVIGVGGTWTSLAAMDQELEPYDPAKVDGYVISRERLERHIHRIGRMTIGERRHIKGLQPARGDIILAGLYIARSFLQRYDLLQVQISERDLMEGIFISRSFQNVTYSV